MWFRDWIVRKRYALAIGSYRIEGAWNMNVIEVIGFRNWTVQT
jgi:hypothetical protein